MPLVYLTNRYLISTLDFVAWYVLGCEGCPCLCAEVKVRGRLEFHLLALVFGDKGLRARLCHFTRLAPTTEVTDMPGFLLACWISNGDPQACRANS